MDMTALRLITVCVVCAMASESESHSAVDIGTITDWMRGGLHPVHDRLLTRRAELGPSFTMPAIFPWRKPTAIWPAGSGLASRRHLLASARP
jgi:hypothetical protein